MEDDVYIPTTNNGNTHFEIKENEDMYQPRGISIGGHITLNLVGKIFTRQRQELNNLEFINISPVLSFNMYWNICFITISRINVIFLFYFDVCYVLR